MARTVPDLIRMRKEGEAIIALTAYDYTFARLLDKAGIDLILVGDSLATVIQGHHTTLPASLEEMLYHTRAVVRGARESLVITDLPFMTYQLGVRDALLAAGRVLKEGGAAGVKIEGGAPVLAVVEKLVESGIPVMGHLGLTPQSVHAMGGHRVQGKDQDSGRRLIDDARGLEQAGAFAIVLEGIPTELAAEVTQRVSIPTIGIGAGPHCSGQILVLHDALGLTQFEGKAPRFVKHFAELGRQVEEALGRYATEVREGKFPAPEHCYHSKAFPKQEEQE